MKILFFFVFKIKYISQNEILAQFVLKYICENSSKKSKFNSSLFKNFNKYSLIKTSPFYKTKKILF